MIILMNNPSSSPCAESYVRWIVAVQVWLYTKHCRALRWAVRISNVDERLPADNIASQNCFSDKNQDLQGLNTVGANDPGNTGRQASNVDRIRD